MLGKGTGSSRIMIVGEAPGRTEDQEGVPFIGDAGKILDKVIQAFWTSIPSRTIEQLYITNVVKCFPTVQDTVAEKMKGRPPTKEEIETCSCWLDLEIKKIQPILIVALGNCALQRITGEERISSKRGLSIWSKKYNCLVYAMFHPSYIRRNSKEWGKMLEDALKLKALLQAPWVEVEVWRKKLQVK